MKKISVLLSLVLLLAGCEGKPDQALGTLEWDSVNSRAIRSEVILEIVVKEGDLVKVGDLLVRLDDRKQLAMVRQLEAELEQARWHEQELIAGPREEEIAEAKARLMSAEVDVETTAKALTRQKSLRKGDFTSQELLDDAENSYLTALAREEERIQTLNKLLVGTRLEQLNQAKAMVVGLQARLEGAVLQLEEYKVVSTRNGRVDSLPFKLGDRPLVNNVVCTILSGEAPWARVYVPEPWHSRIRIGDTMKLRMDGQEQLFNVKVRTISSKSNFTPYFALTEKDRSYLSYVAELDFLDEKARELGSGTPVELLLEGE